ncbi:RNA-binding domain-containing protein [Hesseltinella vesiculosa]|uniref:RNA-binding domain-containing protein n=1 Tax=Hesseltinella vesiculosa TaxID=101127 RepID=A0A1X2GU46_9FUNG|nr:RNA-binding domain-containing protein [Hesseltinella vesiculosa]
MAEYLASIYGTEKDKVNCSFYFKIGACRHGERCSRKHVKPTFSQTLLVANMYKPPMTPDGRPIETGDQKQEFNDFYEDVFSELASFGEVEDMIVCNNVGEHLVGNVYCQFRNEEDAGKAVESLNNRFYAGRPMYAELSPVTDFREACCRQNEISECNRGGFCNFMHLQHPSRSLRRELMEAQRLSIREKRREQREQEGDASRSHREDSSSRRFDEDRGDRDRDRDRRRRYDDDRVDDRRRRRYQDDRRPRYEDDSRRRRYEEHRYEDDHRQPPPPPPEADAYRHHGMSMELDRPAEVKPEHIKDERVMENQ